MPKNPSYIGQYDYDLPAQLIAQRPLEERTQARLMIVDRAGGRISQSRINALPTLLNQGDLLIFNDTRVLPARLLGCREQTGGRWEGLFLQEQNGAWELMCQTRGSPQPGEGFQVEDSPLRLKLLKVAGKGHWLMEPMPQGSPAELLEKYGHIPLPQYIRKGRDEPSDRERYQTVYARHNGAVAAPTAGLHFTPELLELLQNRGIGAGYVTLHVGAGTFQPIQAEDIQNHKMHEEYGCMPAHAVAAIQSCQTSNGRVVAIGTTSLRVLETVAAAGPLRPWTGKTDLYIYPPYEFQVVDALLTNFHLPRSSLFVLVSAFAGRDLIQEAYRTAIAEKYRFYSYGDAMLIV